MQVSSKSTTTRAQIRHHLYVAELKPTAALAPELKQQLLHIADLIHSNRPSAADYELQLIIRDYGPYVIKSVVAGGVFVQERQVRALYMIREHFEHLQTSELQATIVWH